MKVKKAVSEIMAQAIEEFIKLYVDAWGEVQEETDLIENYYRLQDAVGYETRVNVLTTVWAELPRVADKAVPPVNEELIVELERELDVAEGEFEHSWGIVGKLWKSEAISIKEEAQIEALCEVGGLVLDVNGEHCVSELRCRDCATGEMGRNRPSFRLCVGAV